MPTEKQIQEIMKARGCSRDEAIQFFQANQVRSTIQEITPLRRSVGLRLIGEPDQVVEEDRHCTGKPHKHKRFEVTFSSGTRVLRRGFFSEDFHEELSMEPEHVNLERFNSGSAPMLRNHNNDVDDVIGVIEEGSASVDGERGVATVRMSRRESIGELVHDMEEGIVRNLSSGYSVQEFTELEERAPDGLKIFRATKWTPLEVSAVAVGAEGAGAFVGGERSFEKTKCQFITRTHKNEVTRMKWTDEQIKNVMERHACGRDQAIELLDKFDDYDKAMERTQTASPAPAKVEAPKVNVDEVRANERKRIADIQEACRVGNIEQKEVDQFINGDKSADEVRKLVMERMAKADQSTPTSNVNVEVGQDLSREHRRSGIQNAILFRGHSDPKLKPELSEHGREFVHCSLLEMARECAEAAGIRTRRMAKRELVRAAFHSTSDFPELLADTCQKSLRDAYMVFGSTYDPIVTRVSLADFKQASSIQLGSTSLEEILEDGEYKRGSFSEEAEKYSLKTYGRMITLSRQMIINDDLRGLTRIPAMMARAAGQLESDLVWSQITSNPVLADGNPLFHASHANLGAAGAISDVTLGEGRKLMRSQKDADGERINLRSNWLIVPAALETAGEKQVSLISPDEASKVNPFSPGGRSAHGLIVEPRLDDTSAAEFYQAASADQIESIHLATLQGEASPVVETEETFDVDGMKMKVRHDVVAKVVDFRGLVKHPG